MNKSNKQVGFTLVELLVVISIIAILMAIILGVYLSAKGRRDEKKVLAEIKGIETVIHNFHTDNNFFPPDNFDPGTGSFDPEMNGLYKSLTQDFQEGKKNSPPFGRRFSYCHWRFYLLFSLSDSPFATNVRKSISRYQSTTQQAYLSLRLCL